MLMVMPGTNELSAAVIVHGRHGNGCSQICELAGMSKSFLAKNMLL